MYSTFRRTIWETEDTGMALGGVVWSRSIRSCRGQDPVLHFRRRRWGPCGSRLVRAGRRRGGPLALWTYGAGGRHDRVEVKQLASVN